MDSCNVNVHANEVKGWERFLVDMGTFCGTISVILNLLNNPASHEPEVSFNSLFDEGMWANIVENPICKHSL